MAEGERQESSRIFISYRREDSAGFVRALLGPLRQRFGSDRIFKDTDNIPPGEDFVNVIQRELESCKVLLAVIGSEWATVEDPRTKKRRLENPNDYLRLELATALKNAHVIVIPVLVDRAGMPSSEELPEDLGPLARRNAIELSDSRWDTDVERLVHAIEGVCSEPELSAHERTEPPALREPVEQARSPFADPGGGFERLELKRKRQLAEHIAAARQALEMQDFEAVLAACERAIWLDPQEHEARDFAARARAALDERQIQAWLSDAQQALAKGEFSAASEAIDQALARSATHAWAVKLRQDLLRARQERERLREVDRLVAVEIKSARSSFDEEDFSAALYHVEDALALAPESRDALDLKAQIIATRDELQRTREVKRRAQQAIAAAQAEFAAGKYEAALTRLEEFVPAHDLVSQALADLRRQAEEARETARREKAARDAADAAAEQVKRQRAEQAARDEASRAAAVAAAKLEQQERTKREETAARAAREEARQRAEAEERRQAEEARQQAQEARRVEDARKREEDARKREETVGAILKKARNEAADQAAINLLTEGLAIAPGDPRLQALIGERKAAIERRRVEALEKAAAVETARREQERQAREQQARREREEKEARARLALERKEELARRSREESAREVQPTEKRQDHEEAAWISEPKPEWVKYAGVVAAFVAIVAVGMWFARSPAPDTSVQRDDETVQEPVVPATPPATAGTSGTVTTATPPPAGATRGAVPSATRPPVTASRAGVPPVNRAPVSTARGAAVPVSSPPVTATRGNTVEPVSPSAPSAPTGVRVVPDSSVPATAARGTASPVNPSPATAAGGVEPPVVSPPTTEPAVPTRPAVSNLVAERGAIQQLLDRYVAAYSSMDEQRLRAVDPSFRGIPRRELIRSVSLAVRQSELDIAPDGQSARLRVTGDFNYVWNRAGLPPTSPAQWTWNLRKVGTTWTVVP